MGPAIHSYNQASLGSNSAQLRQTIINANMTNRRIAIETDRGDVAQRY